MDYEIRIGPMPYGAARQELAKLFGVTTGEIHGSEGLSWSGSTERTSAPVEMKPIDKRTAGERLLSLATTAGFEAHVTPLMRIWAGGGATWRLFRTKAGGEWGMASVMLETTDLGKVNALARVLARQVPSCTVELFVNDGTTDGERRAGSLGPGEEGIQT